MSSSVLVVAIVGGVVVVIARMAIREAPKPATPRDPANHRAREQPPTAAPEPEPAAAPADERVPAFTGARHFATETLEPLAPSWRQRLRATVLLAVTVVALGAGAGALIGGALYVGVRALDRALG